MGFATFAPTGMAMVLIGLVFDLELVRGESRLELVFDQGLDHAHHHTPVAGCPRQDLVAHHCWTGFCHHICTITRDNSPQSPLPTQGISGPAACTGSAPS